MITSLSYHPILIEAPKYLHNIQNVLVLRLCCILAAILFSPIGQSLTPMH